MLPDRDCDDGDPSIGDCPCEVNYTQNRTLDMLPWVEAYGYSDCDVSWTGVATAATPPAGCPGCDVAWWTEAVGDDSDCASTGWELLDSPTTTLAFGVDVDSAILWFYDAELGSWVDMASRWDTSSTTLGDRSLVQDAYDAAKPEDYWDTYATLTYEWTDGCRYP